MKPQHIQDPQVLSVLNQLHQAARGDTLKIAQVLAIGLFTKIKPEHASTAYLPVSREQGEYLYDLLIRNQSKHIVEFGTSFGISTLYLAAAARQNKGRVITTEVLPEKCAQALENFQQAGLSDWIELRQGDALQTLQDLREPIDFLLLDGWKDLYMLLFRLLEPLFHAKTLIFVDNTNFQDVRNFLKVIRKEPKYQVEKIKLDKGGSALISLNKQA